MVILIMALKVLLFDIFRSQSVFHFCNLQLLWVDFLHLQVAIADKISIFG